MRAPRALKRDFFPHRPGAATGGIRATQQPVPVDARPQHLEFLGAGLGGARYLVRDHGPKPVHATTSSTVRPGCKDTSRMRFSSSVRSIMHRG
jgi:hypothetical protein